MKYNLSKTTPPAMPRLGKGTECVALLPSQASKDMQEPIVPMLFPILGAHVSGAEFMYSDLSWKEMSGMMANLVADSGAGKGQLSSIVEALCRDFRGHDDEELAKLVEWQKMMKTKSANKEKPARPDVALNRNVSNRIETYRNVLKRIESYDCQRPLLYLCTCKRYPPSTHHSPMSTPHVTTHRRPYDTTAHRSAPLASPRIRAAHVIGH